MTRPGELVPAHLPAPAYATFQRLFLTVPADGAAWNAKRLVWLGAGLRNGADLTLRFTAVDVFFDFKLDTPA